MDFTIYNYTLLIKSIRLKHYTFTTFKDFINLNGRIGNFVFLRHDVDRLPKNSLKMAEIEYFLGIRSTYYFRVIHHRFNEKIIKQIMNFGHDIGYHYEDIDLIRKKIKIINKDDEKLLIDLAYNSFCANLACLRKIFPVETICAHGSPLSPFNNQKIWEKYNYKNLGISDAVCDIDWNKSAYLTDTGRCWNGRAVNIRDKVDSKYKFNFKTTIDFINNIDKLPSQLMINIHPQRWNENIIYWAKEFVFQSMKNVIKRHMPAR